MAQQYINSGFKFRVPDSSEPPSLYSLPAQNRISQEEFDDLWGRVYKKTLIVRIVTTILAILVMFLGTLGAISLAEGTKSAGWAMTFIVISMISIFLLVLFIFCAAQKLMNSIARQESEQHWMHRGMKWKVVYQRDPDKGRYYFQLWVIPNTVAFEPRKEVLSDEKNAIRQALIA